MTAPPVDESTPLLTRADAARAGRLYYFTGKTCRKGHLAYRFVSTASCTACHRVYGGNARRARNTIRAERAEGIVTLPAEWRAHRDDLPALADLLDALNFARGIGCAAPTEP